MEAPFDGLLTDYLKLSSGMTIQNLIQLVLLAIELREFILRKLAIFIKREQLTAKEHNRAFPYQIFIPMALKKCGAYIYLLWVRDGWGKVVVLFVNGRCHF